MLWVARIEGRGRIEGGERRGCGLADDTRARLLQGSHHSRIRARPPALVDRRAHLCRKIRRVDDVLDPDGDAAQRPGTCGADGLTTTHKGADGFFVRADRLKRLGDGGTGRKIARIDPALKFGKRHHWHYSL